MRIHTIRRWTAPALATALAGCSAAGGGIPQPTPENPLRGLNAYIERAVEEWGVAGLAIAVVEGDSVVFAEGYGVRDVRTGEPVDPHTIFAIGSNTKLFTAVGAGILVDEGKLEWNDPATEHLPGFQLHDPYVTREITVRDLLSHRSGLGRRGDLLWYGSGLDRSEVLERIRHLEPNSSFRSAFGYQNVMFLAAGEATANAAGTSWDALIDRRIFTPLGMERSTTSPAPLERMENVAQPHLKRDGELVPIRYRNIDNVAPAGSINSSVLDMARWIEMLLAEGSFEGRELVDSATLAEIFSPQTIFPVTPDTLFPSMHFGAYGLGVVLQDYRGEKIAWHTGGIDGMLSLVGMIPDKDVGVVVLTNTAGHNNLFTALMYRVLDSYLGAPPRDWSRILLERVAEGQARAAERLREEEASRVAGTRPSVPLARYAGTYDHPLYGEVVVSDSAGALTLRFGPTLVGELEHWHYDTFRVEWPDGAGLTGDLLSRVSFRMDSGGEIESVEIPGLEAEFEREEEGVLTARANPDDPWHDVRQRIRRQMEERDIPSVTIAVAQGGEIVWEEGFGWADKERRIPATPETMYSLASISKPMTATALMQLVERGAIEIDRPANDYLGAARIQSSAWDPAGATVRRVLSHTAGLPMHWEFFYEGEEHPPRITDEGIARYGVLVNPPGAIYEYSNLGYGILDRIIERVSGRTYAEYMRDEVFLPLDMTRSAVGTGAGLTGAAVRYDTLGSAVPFYDFDHRGASAIYSSARDLVRFGTYHLERPAGREPRVLQDETIDLMQRRATPGSTDAQGYGLGWLVLEDDHGYQRVSHTGGMPGVSTALYLYPEEDLVVAVLINRGGMPAGQLAREAAAVVLPGYADSLRVESERGRTHEPASAPPSELLGRWTGAVRTHEGEVRLSVDVRPDGEVRVRLADQPETSLKDPSFAPAALTGVFAGTIPTHDARQHLHAVRLELWLRDGQLRGQATALSESGGAYFALSSYAELRRDR